MLYGSRCGELGVGGIVQKMSVAETRVIIHNVGHKMTHSQEVVALIEDKMKEKMV